MVMKKDLVTSMNAKIVGSGKETIVLAHGFGGDQSFWDKVVPSLSSKYQVVLFDWCFSGSVKDHTLYDPARYSSYDGYADDLISLMEELELQSAIYVGHSMSSMIGCIASVKRPDLFRRLILVTTSPRFENIEGYEGGFARLGLDQLFSSIEANYEEWASAFSSMVTDPKEPLSQQMFETSLKRMRPDVTLHLAKTVFLCDYRCILSEVTTPCNIIQSRSDAAVPDSIAMYMQSKIAGTCDVDIIDSEGHFPHLTAHAQFLDVLDRILG